MKYLRAVCPVSQFAPSKWVGWTIVSTEVISHRAGVPARGADRSGRRTLSSGQPFAVHHLVKAAP
jgi:hypothetical protein